MLITYYQIHSIYNMLNIQKYQTARRNMLKYFERLPQNDAQKLFIQELHDLIEYADNSLIDYELYINSLKKSTPDKELVYQKNLCNKYKKLLEIFNIDSSLINEIDRY